jgi:hypothetical protein
VVSRSWLLAASFMSFTACVHQAPIAEATRASPTSIPDLSGYDDETRRTIELACLAERTEGPVAYGACLRSHIEALNGRG